jgi:hypothetical protein
MPQKFRTFAVSLGNQTGTLAIRQVAEGTIDNSLPPAPTSMTVDLAGAEPRLIVYDSSSARAFAYTLDAGSVELSAEASFNVGTGWDIVEAFVSNQSPYLMCYRSSDGTFAFYNLADSLSPPMTFSLTHNPGMTKGYTSVKCFRAREGAAFLGYNEGNGSVGIYSFAPSSTPRCEWWHQWAAGWTRFALFQYGAENFFFKTNVKKLNVNIDHVLDDLTAGTVEVGTQLPLDNALQLAVVEPLTLANGEPHFVAYMPDGTTQISRFNGDCLGTTQLARWNSLAQATHAVPYRLGGDAFVLFA